MQIRCLDFGYRLAPVLLAAAQDGHWHRFLNEREDFGERQRAVLLEQSLEGGERDLAGRGDVAERPVRLSAYRRATMQLEAVEQTPVRVRRRFGPNVPRQPQAIEPDVGAQPLAQVRTVEGRVVRHHDGGADELAQRPGDFGRRRRSDEILGSEMVRPHGLPLEGRALGVDQAGIAGELGLTRVPDGGHLDDPGVRPESGGFDIHENERQSGAVDDGRDRLIEADRVQGSCGSEIHRCFPRVELGAVPPPSTTGGGEPGQLPRRR